MANPEKKLQKVGRIALREQGSQWVAYWAAPDTMEGATFIASCAIAPVVANQQRKEQFMQFCRDIVSDLFFDHWGVRPAWPDPPQPAPAHERMGR